MDAPQDDAVPLSLHAAAPHAIPVLLVFALINRADIFDLRPGNSFVEFLLEEGFDVCLLDWGVPGDEDADMGLDYYVCDELPWAMREALRARAGRARLIGWCIGGALVAMHAALERTARRATSCSSPPDRDDGSRYRRWVGIDAFDVDSSPRRCPGDRGPASTSPTS